MITPRIKPSSFFPEEAADDLFVVQQRKAKLEGYVQTLAAMDELIDFAAMAAAVDKACEVLKAAGAKRALPLPVSAPFHSSLMKPAAEKLKAALAETTLAAPQIPVVNNIDVAVETDPDRIRDALYRQAFGPVRWVECIRQIKNMGITIVIECGPGKVLTGMSKRIDAELNAAALYDPETLAAVQAALA